MGKKYFGVILFFIFFFLPSSVVHAEVIRSFDIDITIQKTGVVEMKETIAYDFENEDKHGIYRTIPLIKENSEQKKFKLTIDAIAVSDEEGKAYKFSSSEENDSKKIKIGDPNATVSGLHTYIISYTVKGALTYFSDHDELNWNITGFDWAVPIESVTARIVIPDVTDTSNFQQTCYIGALKSTEQTCSGSMTENGVSFAAARSLSQNENMTVVFGFPKGLVSVLEPTEVNTWFAELITKIFSVVIFIACAIWYFLLPIWVVVRWYRRGRDPKAPMGVAHSWFSVPRSQDKRELTPGETGTLIDERADLKDIIATIIDLARRGHLSIEEKKQGEVYLHKKVNKMIDTMEPFEKDLYDGIFGSKDICDLKKDDLSSVVTKAQKKLYDGMVEEKFFDENPEKVRGRYIILGSFAILTANFALALTAFIFGRSMPRKTLLGSQTSNIAKALKNFLVSQDRQFAYQGKHQLIFERLLPFAIAFGVEKIWAERFKSLNIAKPDWYDGDMRTFNSVLFVNSLTSSMHSFQSSATPTHSSSGFSSGFSGGGGGGGGGGSW